MHSFFSKARARAAQQSTWLWLLFILSVIFLVTYCGFVFIAALSHGVIFDGYAADGPFQLYNPLRRMAAGQTPGVDFQFFHGLGIPFLHFIPFKLLGGNLFASEASRWLVSAGLFLVSSFAFFGTIFRSWRKAAIGTAVITVIALNYNQLMYPGNALLGIRTTFPILVAAAIAWRTNKTIQLISYKIPLNNLIAITCLGLAFVCGTEQGVAAIGAYIVLRAFEFFRSSAKWTAFRSLGTETGLVLFSVVVFVSLATYGHPLSAIRYGLIDIPQDQAWEFGSYPNPFLTWGNLLPSLNTVAMYYVYAILILGVIAVLLIGRFRLVRGHPGLPFIFLLFYGLLTLGSILGYFLPTAQTVPLERGAMLAISTALVAFLFHQERYIKIKAHKDLIKKSVIYTALIITFVLLSISFLKHTDLAYRSAKSLGIRNTLEAAKIARHAPDSFVANPDWKYRLDSFSKYIKPGATVWSTYSSMYESNAGIFNPSSDGFDYVIHALGQKNREDYQQQFVKEKPDYAITLNPFYFYYEEWVWSKVPTFYEQLFTHYTVVAKNGSHYLWKYDDDAPAQTNQRHSVPIKGNVSSYKLPTNTTGNIKVYEITVGYHANAHLLLKKFDYLPRYFIATPNAALQYPISLPPYETSWTLIIPVEPGKTVSIEPHTDGLDPRATLDITSLKYRALNISDRNLNIFEDNYCSIPAASHTKQCESRMLNSSTPEENPNVPD